jgi:hypothetical protein
MLAGFTLTSQQLDGPHHREPVSASFLWSTKAIAHPLMKRSLQ